MKQAAVIILFLITIPLQAQTAEEISFQRTFLLRNATGTAFNPGPEPHHPHLLERGPWTLFQEGALFLSYSSESGPPEQRNEIFSTNWFAAGAQRALGRRGLLLLRGRVSLEPLTMKEEGYPQMLQFISAESGGPLLDSMRAHDLLGEAAAHLGFRTSTTSFLHLYLAPVGVPALGALPYAQRASAEEFAEAPFAYDVQEIASHSTSVITGGFSQRWFGVEASVFHDAATSGRHTSIDTGSIDSRSARLTLTPHPNLSLQLSRGELGDQERAVTSASLSYGTQSLAVTGIYATRETPSGEELASGTAETTFRIRRNTFMVRVEAVDRPTGFLGNPEVERTAHFTFGYLYDFMRPAGYRIGAGVNIDYHTQTHDIEDLYGHKPQAIYLFLRARTAATRRMF